MDGKTSTAAVLLMAAGVFYRGLPQGTRSSNEMPGTNTRAVPAATSDPAPASADIGEWTPVCRYISKIEPKEPGEAVSLDLKIGSNESRHLRGTVKLDAQPDGDEDLARKFCIPKDTHWWIRTLIATVPDPELTHLSLMFDRHIESITRALSDGFDGARYSFDSYWFPWQADARKSEEGDSEKLEKAERERQQRSNKPGLLLFRRNRQIKGWHPEKDLPPEKDLLLVFLVGETPTSGINRVAFQRAWDEGEAVRMGPALPICGGPAQCTGIIGPSFTGSIASLTYLLGSVKSKPQASNGIFVISGSVTGERESDQPLSGVDGVKFCTTIESDESNRNTLFDFLGKDHFAWLQEDETAYGESMGASKGEYLTLRFPRGIARLRNSSAELPGLGSQPPNPLYPQLPLILRDGGEDTIPSFSVQQTPISQESVLVELASALRRHQIRYAGITATDPLDTLFLARAVHALTPDSRIVVLGSDLLFARAAQMWGLDGVLAVSSYPIVSGNLYQRKGNPLTQFASADAEGEYNAALGMLVQRKGANVCDDMYRRSAWLTMLGRNSWWPVAAREILKPGESVEGPRRAQADTSDFALEPSPHLWNAFFFLVWMLCAMHVVFVAGTNWRIPNDPERARKYFRVWWKSSFLRRFAWGCDEPLKPVRRLALAVASLTVAATCCILAACVRASGVSGLSAILEWWLAIIVSAAAVVEAIWASRVFWKARPWQTALTFSGMVLAIGFLGTVLLGSALGTTDRTRQFAAYRAIHIESGTSPAMPIFIFLLAMYIFCYLALSRYRMVEEANAVLAAPGARAVPPLGIWSICMILAVTIAWVIFFRPQTALATVEGNGYDWIIIGLASIVVVLLAFTLGRFWKTWCGLRKVLEDLERRPLRYAFSRLPKAFSWTAVWTGDPRPSLTLPARARDALKMIGKPDLKTELNAIATAVEFFERPDRDFRKVPEHLQALTHAWNEAAWLCTEDMTSEWAKGVSDSIESREEKDGMPDKWKAPDVIAKEEFLALQYVNFISFTFRVMRLFLEFIVYGFILLVLGLSIYPFEGRRQIEIAVVVIFLINGACVGLAFAGMDRDPLLSRLSETKPNELGRNFVLRLVSFGTLPLLTLLAAQVPAVGNFLLSWLQPALEALK